MKFKMEKLILIMQNLVMRKLVRLNIKWLLVKYSLFFLQSFLKILELKQKLKISVIYNYGVNEENTGGLVDDENSDSIEGLSDSSRDFLEMAIKDYNEEFGTSYDTSSEKFSNFYKDVSYKMKSRELDLLIVVNMFLTGLDATTINTLWVDKNLKMYGLI